MLEIKNIVKTYKSKSGVTVKALDNVSLKFPKKGMVFILGKSGSGKSTMLNILGGLDGIDSGEILVNGESTKNFKQAEFDSFRNTYVGFIFQEYNILDNFTVGQNIALAMQLQSRKPTSENINSILKEVELEGLGDRKPNELSGGQKQRVAIARALVKNPQIIMADEPTGALDSATGIQIFDTLKRLSKDKLVVIISHDREFSERYADRIIELKDGKVISDVSLSKNGKEEEEDIIFTGDEIIVRNNYVLKQSDLKVINDYLKKMKKDSKITRKSSSSKDKKLKFVKTNQNAIKTDNQGFKLIKSKLPMKRAFQMGASGLNHKKFKLGMTIVLSLIAFTMLGASVTVGLTNQNSAISNALSSSNYSQLNVGKYTYNVNNFAGAVIKSRGSMIPLSNDDIKNIENIIGPNYITVNQVTMVSTSETTSWINSSNVSISVEKYPQSYQPFNSSFSHFVESTRESLNSHGYTVLDESKELSEDKDIYISLNTFYGLRKMHASYGTDKKFSENDTIKDTIGRTISLSGSGVSGTFTIKGVFDTGLNSLDDRYSKYMSDTTPEYSSMYGDPAYMELCNARNYDLDSCLVGRSGFLNQIKNLFLDSTYYTYRLDTSYLNKKISFSSTMNNNNLLNQLSREYNGTGKTFEKYTINNELVYNLESSLNNLEPVRIIFLYIGLAFILFSGLLLANFIANSISYQRREIGILRAIGARGRDVFKIYISEAFIIAAANFVLSIISTWAVTRFALAPQLTKMTAGISVIKFGFISVLILFGVSFLSALIATYIPVYKTAKKRPVEAIRNK